MTSKDTADTSGVTGPAPRTITDDDGRATVAVEDGIVTIIHTATDGTTQRLSLDGTVFERIADTVNDLRMEDFR